MDNVPSSAVLAIIAVVMTAMFIVFVAAAAGVFGDFQLRSNKKTADTTNTVSREVLEQYDGRYVTGTQIEDLISQLQDNVANKVGIRVTYTNQSGALVTNNYLYNYNQGSQTFTKVSGNVSTARNDFRAAKVEDTVFTGRLLHMYADDDNSEIMMIVFGSSDPGDVINSDTSHVLYKVTINSDKGANTGAVSLSGPSGADYQFHAGDSVTVNASTSILPGYAFDGWTSSPSGLVDGSTNANFKFTMPKSSVSLTAKTRLILYTISYVDEAGNVIHVNGNPVNYNVESGLITLNNPASTSEKVFAGWRDDAGNVSSKMEIPAGSTGDKTFTAIFTKQQYTVKFNGNGATGGSMPDQVFNYNEAKGLTANAFTRTGYAFIGWGTSASASKASYANEQTVTNPGSTNANNTLTLYAMWTPSDTFTLSYNVNPGTMQSGTSDTTTTQTPTPSAVTVTKTVKAGSAIGTLENTTRAGFTFDGWYTAPTGGQKVTSSYKMPESDLTLYAHWTALTYTIKYDLNGGKFAPSSTYPSTYTAQAKTFVLPGGTLTTYTKDKSGNIHASKTEENPAPVKTGYIFAGWTGTGVGTATKTVTIIPGSIGNRTYKATWTPQKYTVLFDPQNGITEHYNAPEAGKASVQQWLTRYASYNGTLSDWPIKETTYEYTGKNATASQKQLPFRKADGTTVKYYTYKPGYVFAGWWTTTDVTGEKLTSTTKITKDVTYYAHYTKAWTYSVKFHGNGATSGQMDTVTYTYGQTGKLPANKFAKTGYTFVGWTTKYDKVKNQPVYTITYKDQASVYNLSEEENGVVDMYALWTPSSTTITDKNGSSKAPLSGYYLVEAWGAQGGGNGGLGGYSRAIVKLSEGDVLYASVGTQGTYVTTTDKTAAEAALKADTSGANGGGKPSQIHTTSFNGQTLYEYLTGGGATSVSLKKGDLSTLAKGDLVVVAGGGAASYGNISGGEGGGLAGDGGE